MDLFKAMAFAAVLTGCVAIVIGSQGTGGGPLAIEAHTLNGIKLYWSWPVFVCSSGLGWGLLLLQR